jgi:hypothetical protein
MVTNDYCDVVSALTLMVMLRPGLAGADLAYKYDMCILDFVCTGHEFGDTE